MKWSDVRKLHVEISALCNAACPQCARYPTASYYEHPNIKSTDVWTLEQVKQKLPPEDLSLIEEYLINGTVGDFITNRDALEIVEYIAQCSPTAEILINTNGSARTDEFWTSLAHVPNVTVNFGIDGLADTHELYRRQTDWLRIMHNAAIYIAAGGRAEWIMTVFAHNQHQVEDCKALALQAGFARFTARHSDRPSTPVRNRAGVVTHWLLPAENSAVQVGTRSATGLAANEARMKQGIIQSYQEHNIIPLPSINNCDSIKFKSIYVGANWSVAPCCFIGALSFTGLGDSRYDNFIAALASAGFNESDLIATNTVRAVVEQGFDFIYSKIATASALTACYRACHPGKSNFRTSQATKIVAT